MLFVFLGNLAIRVEMGMVYLQHVLSQIIQRVNTAKWIANGYPKPISHTVEANGVVPELIEIDIFILAAFFVGRGHHSESFS